MTNATSPGLITLFLQDDHYPTGEAALAASADAIKAEWETIVAAGRDIRLDCRDDGMPTCASTPVFHIVTNNRN
ncbi:hypothetical protein [Yoonia sediminilitoris]|uniref:hypothetical protein n=1 Tax=Yoonia sediminilitoris TaxID=1286148 RepID=UPI000D375D3B